GGLAYGGWFYWNKHKEATEPKRRELPQAFVEAVPVELGTFETFTSTVGTLKSNESVVIRPEVDGMIKAIRFKSGEAVSKGDVLITLQDGVYRAMKKEAEAKVQLWKGKHERASILYERKAGTLKEKEETLSQLAISQAELD